MRTALLVALAIGLAGCGDARSRAVKKVKRIGPNVLRKQANYYYKNIYASRRLTFLTLSREQWPGPFAQLEPERITVYEDGFALLLEREGDAESGLYIIPLHMDHAPASTARASFQQLSEGIYWYSFKP